MVDPIKKYLMDEEGIEIIQEIIMENIPHDRFKASHSTPIGSEQRTNQSILTTD